MSSYVRALRFALSSQANAYGFTLVIWGTGGLAISGIGIPDPAEVFSFVGGALIAVTLLVAVAFGAGGRLPVPALERHASSALHLAAVPLAMLAGWSMAALLGGWPGYLTASLVAVLVYELILAVQIRVMSTEGESLPDR